MDTNSTKFFKFLKTRLKKELPGAKAQIKMAPFGDLERLNKNIPRDSSRKSAVLLLINQDLELLFTLRSSSLRNHSGQISFPGGRVDLDETFEQTAIRETNEEVGIDNDAIEILGRLSYLYVPPSDSVIQPIVAKLNYRSEMTLNPAEVEEAFYVPLEKFVNQDQIKIKKTKIKSSIES